LFTAEAQSALNLLLVILVTHYVLRLTCLVCSAAFIRA